MADATMADTITTKSTLPSPHVSKPTPYLHHPSYLSTTDPNPLPPTTSLLALSPSTLEATLLPLARDATQSLLTHLLTSPTTTITPTPTSLLMTLPPTNPTPLLPRRLPLPVPKPPTKWETFARKKGIGKYGSNTSGGAALTERKKNLVYDEQSGEWVRKWGYKGKNQREEGEWLVEVDDQKRNKGHKKAEEEEGRSVRTEGRRERMERVRRQVRRERRNEKRGGKGGKT